MHTLNDIRQAQALFEKYQEPSWKGLCQVARYAAPDLILIVQNSSLASLIRMKSTELIKCLAQENYFRHLQNIHCKINKYFSASPLKKNPQTTWAAHHQEHVLKIADSISDEKIRALLKKIAEEAGTNKTIK